MNKRIALMALAVAVMLSTGCGKLTSLLTRPTNTPTPLPATSTWTPIPTSDAGIQTPAPGRIAVTLATARTSPSKGWFELYNAAGEKLWQGGEFINVLYLVPGEYRYRAMAPIPTQTLGCYNVVQDYGYYTEKNFTVVDRPLYFEVKLGMIIAFCTYTPTP